METGQPVVEIFMPAERKMHLKSQLSRSNLVFFVCCGTVLRWKKPGQPCQILFFWFQSTAYRPRKT